MKLIQFIRAFWLLSSLIFLAFLVVQMLRIQYYYKPNELMITTKEILDQSVQVFNQTSTYQSFEMVSEHSFCSPGYEQVIKYSGQEATLFCKCGEDIIIGGCSQVSSEIQQVKKCETIVQTVDNYNFPLKDNISSEPFTSVKLCGKKMNPMKISWFEDTYYSRSQGQGKYYQYCPFSDTYKQGFIKSTFECPQTNAEFKCLHEGEKKCESRFLIYCTGIQEDCTQSSLNRCAHDEIGCFSKNANFCIKNTEQCPITDMKLIKSSERILQGYEVQSMRFPSDLKLIVQRSNFDYHYINEITFSSNSNNYNNNNNGIPIEGIQGIKRDEFLKTNKMDIPSYSYNVTMYINMHRQQQRGLETYFWRNRIKMEEIQEYNEQIQSTYDLIYKSRMICIQLLLLKFIFEFIRCIKTYKIEESEDSLGRILDKINLRFYFLLEILMLVLILTVFTNKLDFTSWTIDNLLYSLDRNKGSKWSEASNVNNIGALTIVAIVFFGVTKLIALILLIIKKCRERRKQKTIKIEKVPLSDQQQQEEQISQYQQIVEFNYVEMK